MNTRTALLDSAELAARQRGYDAFSFADLARDVGIRKASIHHHFPRKADLALELIERYAETFKAALSEIDQTEPSAIAKLKAYQQLYRDALADGTQLCLCVAFSAGRGSLPEPVLERLEQFHEDSVSWLAEVIGQAGWANAKAEARATLALMEGAQLLARATQDIDQFDLATAAFLARLSPKTRH